jgi:transposase
MTQRDSATNDVVPYFGLTPSKYQSGEVDSAGRISKVGNAMVRTALFEAANVMLSRVTQFSTFEGLGAAGREATRDQAGEDGPGAQTCGAAAPDMGRRH